MNEHLGLLLIILEELKYLKTNFKLSHYSEKYDRMFKGFTIEELKNKLKKRSEDYIDERTKVSSLSKM